MFEKSDAEVLNESLNRFRTETGMGAAELSLDSLSADFVWRYSTTAKTRWEPLPNVQESWNYWIPFASLVEFVQTMSQATQHAAAAFWWPCSKLAFFKSLEVRPEEISLIDRLPWQRRAIFEILRQEAEGNITLPK